MIASSKGFYPEGTDLSYFDKYHTDLEVRCPSCSELGDQIVFIDGNNRHLEGECIECEHTWEEDWVEEPDFDMSDIDYYDKF